MDTPSSHLSELAELVGDMKALEADYDGAAFPRATTDWQHAQFIRLVVQAQSLMNDAVGPLNPYSAPLLMASSTAQRMPPTVLDVRGIRALLEGAIGHVQRELRKRASQPTAATGSNKPHYVDLSRITDLQAAANNKWDTTRLAKLLQELNAANESGAHMATAMLVRAVMDHVPPIFGVKNFNEVANNYFPATSSAGKNLKHLQNSMRNIADAHLHAPIRSKEVLPTATQVDFHTDLDVLLQEVLRLLKQ